MRVGGVRVGVGRVETASKVNCACGKARGMEEGERREGGGRRREKGSREGEGRKGGGREEEGEREEEGRV